MELNTLLSTEKGCFYRIVNWKGTTEIGKSLNYDGLCKFRKYLQNLFHSVLTLKPQKKNETITSQLCSRNGSDSDSDSNGNSDDNVNGTTRIHIEAGQNVLYRIRFGFNFLDESALYACDYAVQLN